MKHKIFSAIAIATSLMMTSCQDWLDVKPEGTPNEATFWKTDRNYSDALVPIYDRLSYEETFGRDLFWEQGASDDIFFSRARGPKQMNLANLQMNGRTESSTKDIYEYMYEMMNGANDVIYHALKVSNRTPRINMHLGEAYFLRAFSHYLIAYRYGRVDNGVPFLKAEDNKEYEPSALPIQQKSVTDNYKLIIEDLDKAIALLPYFKDVKDEADYGRATRDAAIGLKVKVYAYWAQHDPSKWTEIPALVDKVESEGARALEPNFADVFKVANEWGSEYIWSINSSGKTMAGSIFPGIVLDNKGWGNYNGWGNFKPTLELWAEYDDMDLRRPATILQYGDEFVFLGENRKFYSDVDLECGFHFNKYMDPFSDKSMLSDNGNRPTTDLNLPVIRFAELLLFKAEALIEQGQGAAAATVLNRISSRAGMGNLYTNATIEDLMHERRCELAGEYTDRLMDLKRWAAKYPIAKAKLEAPKHGLAYKDRSNPDSELKDNAPAQKDADGNVTYPEIKGMTINGKSFPKGVIEIMAAKKYNADIYSVLPYDPNEVARFQGKLKQNPGYSD